MSSLKHTALLGDVLSMHRQGLNISAIAAAMNLDKIQAKRLLREALDTENEDD